MNWRVRVTLTLMRLAVLITLALVASPLAAQDQAEKPCFCRNSDGEKVMLGDIACLQVGSTMFMARCSMSLNVLTWRKVADGCLSSQISTPKKLVAL